MRQIGKGSFTTAYLKPDKKVVLLKSCDPIKECMAYGWFPNSRLFPKVSFGEQDGTYLMKYYPKVSSLKQALVPKDYALYLELKNLWKQMPNGAGFNEVLAVFKLISNRHTRKIMIEALEACGNYGSDVVFEISPRNVAVSPTGRLILLDCFFMRSKLKELRRLGG